METLWKAAIVGILTVIFSGTLQKKELMVVLSLGACAVIALMLLDVLRPILDFLKTLRNMSGVDKALMEPMLKAIGIGLLTNISANVCADAGHSSITKLIELCGAMLAIYVSLPLLEMVLQTVQRLGGGS